MSKNEIGLELQKVRESIANKIQKVELLAQETLKDIQQKTVRKRKIKTA